MLHLPVIRYARTLLSLIAFFILGLYGWIVWQVTFGVQTSTALDPVWAAARERGSLRIAVDAGFRPFADQIDGEFIGYDVELATTIAQRLGLQPEFVIVGFDGLYDSLVSGRSDLIASALVYAPEQGYRARFSQVYFDAGQVLVVPQDSDISRVEDLSQQRLGTALGSDADSLARQIEQDMSNVQLYSAYETAEAALDALLSDDLDAVLCDMVSALNYTQPADTELRIAQALSSEPYVLAMPISAFQLELEVNRVLADLQREGYFAELNNRWFR